MPRGAKRCQEVLVSCCTFVVFRAKIWLDSSPVVKRRLIVSRLASRCFQTYYDSIPRSISQWSEGTPFTSSVLQSRDLGSQGCCRRTCPRSQAVVAASKGSNAQGLCTVAKWRLKGIITWNPDGLEVTVWSSRSADQLNVLQGQGMIPSRRLPRLESTELMIGIFFVYMMSVSTTVCTHECSAIYRTYMNIWWHMHVQLYDSYDYITIWIPQGPSAHCFFAMSWDFHPIPEDEVIFTQRKPDNHQF